MLKQNGDWNLFDDPQSEEAKKAINTVVTNVAGKELTDEQKDFVNHNWDAMDLLSLVRATFEDEKLDGRSLQARLIKKFLGERKTKTTKHEKVQPVVLTEDQKEYIGTNVSLMSAFEMGKIIFNNPRLEPLSKHVMTINKFIKDLDEGTEKYDQEESVSEEYKAPTQLSAVVGKINKYLRKELDLKALPTVQRKSMEAIRNFLHAPRFLQSINAYIAMNQREMFEGEFIRTIYDKPDLSPDELNICVTLCQKYVQGVTLAKHINILNTKYEDDMEEGGRLSMTLAEMIKVKTDELDKCEKTQKVLVEFLSGQRSKRQDKQVGNSASVARLIEWWREEEERQKALKIAERQHEEDKEEVVRIETLPDIKARVLGISTSEMLHG